MILTFHALYAVTVNFSPRTRNLYGIPIGNLYSTGAEKNSLEMDNLTAFMDLKSLSMLKMTKKHVQLDNLIAIVSQRHLDLSSYKDSKQNEAQ